MEVNEDQNVQKWLLSKPEREYLNGEDVKNESKRTRNLKNKRVPNLGNRIQRLIDDIALLEKGGYLNQTENTLEKEDVIQIEPRLAVRNRKISQPDIRTSSKTDMKCGIALGQVVRTLSGSVPTTVDRYDVIWGFILGIYGSESEFETEFHNRLHHLLEDLQQREEQSIESSTHNPVSAERIEEVLVGYSNIVETKNPPIHLEIIQIKSDKMNYDPESFSPSIMDTIEYSVEEARRYFLLADILDKFRQNVTHSKWKHVESEKVFQEAWLANKKISSEEIKAAYNNKYRDKITDTKIVSKIMADLAGQDRGQRHKRGSEEWAENPLVNEIKERRGRKWQVTPYGSVAGKCAFRDNGPRVIKRNIVQLLTEGYATTQIQEEIKQTVSQLSLD